MLADAAVVEDPQPHPLIGVAVVGDPFWVLGVAESVAGVAAVAQRLDRRGAAAAQCQLRQGLGGSAEVVGQPGQVSDQLGAVAHCLNGGCQTGLQVPQLGAPRGRLARPGQRDGIM
jgi:hypothetical protein